MHDDGEAQLAAFQHHSWQREREASSLNDGMRVWEHGRDAGIGVIATKGEIAGIGEPTDFFARFAAEQSADQKLSLQNHVKLPGVDEVHQILASIQKNQPEGPGANSGLIAASPQNPTNSNKQTNSIDNDYNLQRKVTKEQYEIHQLI